jgi:hypothetical protein
LRTSIRQWPRATPSGFSNGIEYEQFLRNIHKDNPEYEFLRPNSKHYHYYLQQLAVALRPTSTHAQQKQSGWTSLPENAVTKLSAMQVGLMCEIVKEAARKVLHLLSKGLAPYATLSQEEVSKLMAEVLASPAKQPIVEVKEQTK